MRYDIYIYIYTYISLGAKGLMIQLHLKVQLVLFSLYKIQSVNYVQ